jgi:hypothetical protein
MQQLALIGPPAPPAPARKRCVHCGAGFVPLSRTEAVAEQRAAADRADTYAREWLAFVATRPGAVAKIVSRALVIARATPGRIAIAKVWEDCRRRIRGGLDQNHRAPAARWMMANVPELAGRFVTRDRAGQQAERARP